MVLFESSVKAGLIPPSALGSWLVEGYPWQPPLVGMGITPSAIPKTLGLSLPGEALVQVYHVLGHIWDARGFRTILLLLLRENHPLEDLLIHEGEVPFHLLPSAPKCSLPVSVAHLQQADYSAPPNAGGPSCTLPLSPGVSP